MPQLPTSTHTSESVRLLVLEDNPGDLLILERELRAFSGAMPALTISPFTRLSEALDAAAGSRFDVCIMDLNLPDSTGVETFERLSAAIGETPVIVVSGIDDAQTSSHVLRHGAQDYVVKKPGMGSLLLRGIRSAVERNKAQVELQLRDNQLRRNERQIRRIIEASADAVIVSDRAGCIRFVNPAAERMFGKAGDELIGTGLGFLLTKDNEIDVVRLGAIDAEVRCVEIQWEEQPALLASLRDVTERKREQESLEMRARLASLSAEIEYSLTGASTLELGLRVAVEVVLEYADGVGARVWTLDEATGELVLAAVAGESPDDPVPLGTCAAMGAGTAQRVARTRELLARTVDAHNAGARADAAGESEPEALPLAGFPIEVEGRLAGILEVYCRHALSAPVLQSLVSNTRTIGLFIARKRAESGLIRAKEAAEAAEAAIRESSEQLNLALRASGTGIWTWDPVARRLHWDDCTHELFGIEPGAFNGTLGEAAAVLHADDRDGFEQALHSAAQGNPGIQTEFRVVRPGGRVRYLVSSGRAYQDASGRLLRVMGTVHDVTQRRQLEEQLRQANRIEAIGGLAGGIAHDFNNILNVVIGYANLMLRNERDPARNRRLQEIRDAGERGAALTRQLLAFSRKQVLRPRVLNLAETLRGMDHMLRRLIGEDVEVVTAIGPCLGNVKVDPSQIEQVILNLVVNARDAMPAGGRLTINLENREWQPSGDAVNSAVGRYVVMEVSDTGCGMSPEVQARALEPFFTTKEVGRGTGMGLSTVYGIVQQSGGHLQIYSEPGVGTSMKVLLPLVDEAGEPVAPAGTGPHLLVGDETILVVEDDDAVRQQVVATLETAGYRVIAAANGPEAMRITGALPDRIHLLLTDVVMPKQSGRDVAGQLSARRPDLKVIYMSGYPGNTITNNGTLDPAVHFLDKPFSPGDLCRKVRLVLNSPARPALRVLTVNDEPELRQWLADLLTGSGYQVTTAPDGYAALALCVNQRFDVVITDLLIPGKEGIETIREIRRIQPGTRIIAISGVAEEGALQAARAAGAHLSFAKPIHEQTVLAGLRQLTGGDSP
jgi:PAS domain S-box-containing protein